MSITTALKARREALADREAGFTLIELLVVVLIIGILAAIAIPVYLGVQNNAKDSGVQSDMAADKTAVTAYFTNNPAVSTKPVLPIQATPTDKTAIEIKADGFTFNSANYTATGVPTFATDSKFPSQWCIDAVTKQGTTFSVSANTGVAKQTCKTLALANY